MVTSIHVKVEASEANLLKKEILLTEQALINSIKSIRKYNLLRKQEFLLKSSIKKDIEHIEILMRSLEEHLPKEDMHYKIIPEKKSKEKPIIKKKPVMKTVNQDIELELDRIQKELSRLN